MNEDMSLVQIGTLKQKYYKDVSPPQVDLQILYNFKQATCRIFPYNSIKYSKIDLEKFIGEKIKEQFFLKNNVGNLVHNIFKIDCRTIQKDGIVGIGYKYRSLENNKIQKYIQLHISLIYDNETSSHEIFADSIVNFKINQIIEISVFFKFSKTCWKMS